LLDLGADNLVSEIEAMKAKAIYGSSTDAKFQEIKNELATKKLTVKPTESIPQCYGVIFQKSANIFTVNGFAVNFANTKVWSGDNWQYQGCDKLDVSKGLTALSSDAQMHIADISDDKGLKYQGLILRFLPPDGKLEAIDNAGKTIQAKVLKITVTYGDTVDPNYQREIALDLRNSSFNVNKIENVK